MSSAACNMRATDAALLDERLLARAFASFTEAADSLERSYRQLQAEVGRLRRELEETNRDLNRSLDENQRIRERLDRTLEGLPCGVVVIEIDGTVSVANPEAGRLLHIFPRQSLPHTGAELLAKADDCRSIEFHLPDAAVEWIAIRRAQTEAGRGAIYIVEDISEAKRFEQQRESLQRQEALAGMSATLAHEIRNPLASMELFAGLLGESELTGECREWVEQLQAGLRTLSATVNNVLHFHSEPGPAISTVDAGQLLRSVHAFLRPLAQRGKICLRLNQQLDGVLIPADRHRIEQVLLNLALNAIRVVPENGVLELSGERVDEGGDVRIAVYDNGPGIPPEHISKIFEPGFSTREGSPGLGLAVCKKIMDQHGGTISVSSKVGTGTRFCLKFAGAGQ